MKNLLISDLLKLKDVKAVNLQPLSECRLPQISTDTRSISERNIFLALRGDNFNGHGFVDEAFARKALFCIVDEKWSKRNISKYSGLPFLVVKNTLTAYGEIALLHRGLFNIPLIAITGSNGKTSAKELIAAVLRTKYTVLSTTGNFNNQVGLPSTLLQLDDSHEIVVLELGTNQPGDIPYLCSIANPTHGLITNIGRAHLEKLISKEGIAQEKGAIYRTLPKDGIAFVNLDEPLVKSHLRRNQRKVTFGAHLKADIRISGLTLNGQARPIVQIEAPQFVSSQIKLALKSHGRHSAYTAAAALAVGFSFGCSATAMKRVIQEYECYTGRMEVVETDGITIINDTYNANPDSVLAALDTLSHMTSEGEKIVVLGDMFELGKASRVEHRCIGEKIAELKFPYVFTYGNHSKEISIAAGNSVRFAQHFSDKSSLADALNALVSPGDVILVKGSRYMKMEDIVASLHHSINKGEKVK